MHGTAMSTYCRATANTQRGRKATQQQQAAILEAAKSLEALNPTDSPATSPLINGRWSLLYQGEPDSETCLVVRKLLSEGVCRHQHNSRTHASCTAMLHRVAIDCGTEATCCYVMGAVPARDSRLVEGPGTLHETLRSIFATGSEEVTKKRKPLEGPVINFFHPILGFLFRTLVSACSAFEVLLSLACCSPTCPQSVRSAEVGHRHRGVG